MSLLVLGSAKASPGVSTTVLALAATWPTDRHVQIIEADPDGGVLAARQGLPSEPGLSTLAVSSRRSLAPQDLDVHLQAPAGSDIRFLVAPPAAEQSRRSLGLAATPLATALPRLDGIDTIVDAGRLRPDSEAMPLVEAADAVLLIARPRVDELQQLPARLRALRPTLARVGLLLIGDKPYPPAEVAVALDVEVVAVIADNRRAAEALGGVGSAAHLGRSPLLRSVRNAGEAIRAWLPSTEPADPAADLSVPDLASASSRQEGAR
jgi:hypothetical protein